MKIAIAITGASGSIYAQQLIDCLYKFEQQHTVVVICSPTSQQVAHEELGKAINTYNFKVYDYMDFYAPSASGSAQFDALIVCPCSMGTMAKIAHGISDNLITRTADVMLKERKKLILAIRETPYNLIHIKNMELITQAGGIICPASPSFYSNPLTIEDATLTVVHRILQLADIAIDSFQWGSAVAPKS